MRGHFSAPSPNSSNTQHPTTTTTMSQNQSGNKTNKPKTLEAKSMDDPASKILEEEEVEVEVEVEEEEEEEEGECGFCLFMKAGECRETFVEWEECIDAAEDNKEDITAKCSKVYGALKECMQAHHDYYEPILTAEKAADELAARESEKEKAEEREEA